MAPKSHTLFHFTKTIEILKQIIRDGFWPRYSLEDIRWIGLEQVDAVAFPMVSFCDIPLGRISEHLEFYGHYGLGLTRKWAKANGLNPVLYLASDKLTDAMRAINAGIPVRSPIDSPPDNPDDIIQKTAKTAMLFVYMHGSPLSGRMNLNGEIVEKDFYQESEWRYIPEHNEITSFIPKSAFDNAQFLEVVNSASKAHGSITINPTDVKYIFVKSDSDIPDLIDFIEADMDQYPRRELTVLISKILSLESIQDDL